MRSKPVARTQERFRERVYTHTKCAQNEGCCAVLNLYRRLGGGTYTHIYIKADIRVHACIHKLDRMPVFARRPRRGAEKKQWRRRVRVLLERCRERETWLVCLIARKVRGYINEVCGMPKVERPISCYTSRELERALISERSCACLRERDDLRLIILSEFLRLQNYCSLYYTNGLYIFLNK